MNNVAHIESNIWCILPNLEWSLSHASCGSHTRSEMHVSKWSLVVQGEEFWP